MEINTNNIKQIIIAAIVGAITTTSVAGISFVIKSPVFAMALVTILYYLLVMKLDQKLQALLPVVYCAAFVGTTDLQIFNDWLYLVMIGTIASMSVLLLENYFVGKGGKLGMIAFVNVVAIYFLWTIVKS